MATKPPSNVPAPVPARPAPTAPKPAGARPIPAAPASTPTPAAQGGGEQPTGDEAPLGNRFLMFNAMPSWLVSMVVHTILIIVLALFTFSSDTGQDFINMLAPKEEEIDEVEEFVIEEIKPLDVTTFESSNTPVTDPQPQMVPTEVTDVQFSDDLDAAPIAIELSDFGERTAPKNDLLAEIGTLQGTGISGRGAAQRGNMVARYGGNEASEAAVAAALRWFAQHQLPDGGWSFDHTPGYCQGRCSHPGSAKEARFGATAMALLPFLGAGQTHTQGKKEYQAVVKAGLAYLIRNQKPQNGGGSFHEGGGSMYSHGLAAIAVCEAYAMTHDKGLLGPAQASLNFIMYAQDPVGGGWRYSPRSAGDTSVVGWQLMALKSGHMGYLQVDPNTIRGANKFLDAVSADSGSFYGYTGPGKGQATTAVGLLCRMYLGWDKDNAALERGAQWLATTGPSKANGRGNMYYNYYATQVMRHFYAEENSKEWETWNTAMRDWLVESQATAKDGHMEGSWWMAGDHGAERGGRVYVTSMATMILEVYYRHMPIYKQTAATEEFPL